MNPRFYKRGMTLLEMMFATAIFTMVMACILSVAVVFGDTSEVYRIQSENNDQLRQAMDFIVKDLHQASRASINWTALPGRVLTYSVPTDLDGNGVPVSNTFTAELSPARTIRRDMYDVNGDGRTATQLVWIRPGNARPNQVLANGLTELAETPAADGTFGPTQDTNKNGRLDNGIWFESANGGIRVTLETEGKTRKTGGKTGSILTQYQETIIPRN